MGLTFILRVNHPLVMHELKTSAFILRIIQAQEADLVVKLLSASGEKVTAFAKAGLKSKKRFGGSLEPLLNVQIRAFRKNDQELYYLQEVLVKHDFKKIKLDMKHLLAAIHISELVEDSAQEGLQHPEIYNLFGAALKTLSTSEQVDEILRLFELKLLSILGWLPTLDKCAECGASGDLSLESTNGFVHCENCGLYPIALPLELQSVLRQALQTPMAQLALPKEFSHRVHGLTTALLQAHWGDRKFKSSSFLESCKRFQKNFSDLEL